MDLNILQNKLQKDMDLKILEKKLQTDLKEYDAYLQKEKVEDPFLEEEQKIISDNIKVAKKYNLDKTYIYRLKKISYTQKIMNYLFDNAEKSFMLFDDSNESFLSNDDRLSGKINSMYKRVEKIPLIIKIKSDIQEKELELLENKEDIEKIELFSKNSALLEVDINNEVKEGINLFYDEIFILYEKRYKPLFDNQRFLEMLDFYIKEIKNATKIILDIFYYSH